MEINQILGVITGAAGVIAMLCFPRWFFGEPDDRPGFYKSRGKRARKNFF